MDLHRGSFQLYIFFCIEANTLLIQLTGPSLDVSFTFSVGCFCGPRPSACVLTLATPDGERKRDEKSNPASHTADIQRRDKKTHHTSNHEELERLLNQTVVLTELTAPPTVFIVAERRQEVALKPGNRETSLTGGSASLLGIYIYPQLLRLRSERLNFRLRLRKGRRRLRKQVFPKYSEAWEVKTDSKLKKRKHLITN